MLYRLKVTLLKIPRLNLLWRHWLARRGVAVGNYADLGPLVETHARGHSFADVGCMWGVNGDFAFRAERAGATRVIAVDVFGPTPEFEQKHRAQRSRVQFVLGDISRVETIAKIGEVDVVFCAGVLYHHPSPFDLLVALRRICRQTLILRTSTIPEVPGLPNAAVFYPMLSPDARELWKLTSLGVMHQAAISSEFRSEDGYGNWFWGLTPSCLESLLKTAGLEVERRATEANAETQA
jgi:2-polyprenyl-3-methyl-5-hydroxy-6-metoxy-1,4-benzoquinol methylase